MSTTRGNPRKTGRSRSSGSASVLCRSVSAGEAIGGPALRLTGERRRADMARYSIVGCKAQSREARMIAG